MFSILSKNLYTTTKNWSIETWTELEGIVLFLNIHNILCIFKSKVTDYNLDDIKIPDVIIKEGFLEHIDDIKILISLIQYKQMRNFTPYDVYNHISTMFYNYIINYIDNLYNNDYNYDKNYLINLISNKMKLNNVNNINKCMSIVDDYVKLSYTINKDLYGEICDIDINDILSKEDIKSFLDYFKTKDKTILRIFIYLISFFGREDKDISDYFCSWNNMEDMIDFVYDPKFQLFWNNYINKFCLK